jgi:hypothetical protein
MSTSPLPLPKPPALLPVGAEDGLAFGSVHPRAALELVLWLLRTGSACSVYFDTFPR